MSHAIERIPLSEGIAVKSILGDIPIARLDELIISGHVLTGIVDGDPTIVTVQETAHAFIYKRSLKAGIPDDKKAAKQFVSDVAGWLNDAIINGEKPVGIGLPALRGVRERVKHDGGVQVAYDADKGLYASLDALFAGMASVEGANIVVYASTETLASLEVQDGGAYKAAKLKDIGFAVYDQDAQSDIIGDHELFAIRTDALSMWACDEPRFHVKRRPISGEYDLSFEWTAGLRATASCAVGRVHGITT